MCTETERCDRIIEMQDVLRDMHLGKKRGYFLIGAIDPSKESSKSEFSEAQVYAGMKDANKLEALEGLIAWLTVNGMSRSDLARYCIETDDDAPSDIAHVQRY